MPPRLPLFSIDGDVADAAAARLGIAEGVLDHPLVDAPRLVEVAGCAGGDLVGGLLDDAVGGDEVGRRRVERLRSSARESRHAAGLGKVDDAVAGGELARHLHDRRLLVVGPYDVQELGAVLRVALDLGDLGVGGPGAARRAEPVRRAEGRQRHPRLHWPPAAWRSPAASRSGNCATRRAWERRCPARNAAPGSAVAAATSAPPAFKTSRLFMRHCASSLFAVLLVSLGMLPRRSLSSAARTSARDQSTSPSTKRRACRARGRARRWSAGCRRPTPWSRRGRRRARRES